MISFEKDETGVMKYAEMAENVKVFFWRIIANCTHEICFW